VFIYVCNINTMKHLLFFLLLLLTTPIFSQIKVEDVGDGWKNKIELALDLIKRTDSNYYNHVIDNCEHIGFWAGKYSTNEGTSIYMTKYDFEMNSIQNLACIIVHESKHIEFSKNKIILSEKEEECICYKYEKEFLFKVEIPERRLLENVFYRIESFCN
jgi:hypothetical protein